MNVSTEFSFWQDKIFQLMLWPTMEYHLAFPAQSFSKSIASFFTDEFLGCLGSYSKLQNK